MYKKTYFILSEYTLKRDGHGWVGLALAALNKASELGLNPHLIFDGAWSPFVQKLIDLGVKVIYKKSEYSDFLESKFIDNPLLCSIAKTAFLLFEIWNVEDDANHVLYCDLDVEFLNFNESDFVLTETIAATNQTSRSNILDDLNCGVMFLNIPYLKKNDKKFKEFILNYTNKWTGFNQHFIREFYGLAAEKISDLYNWKPYWGIVDDIKILHWHGPKPASLVSLPENIPEHPTWDKLYTPARDFYFHYINQTNAFKFADPKVDIQANIEIISNNSIKGWAFDKSKLDPVLLSVYDGKDHILDFFADQPRSDILEKFGFYKSGFNIEVPHNAYSSFKLYDNLGLPVAL